MGVITVLYLGIVVVTIGTRTYGSSQQDHVSIAQLLSQGMGIDATGVAAVLAVVISLGTANAYIAAISRLGYALARDGAFPSWMGGLDRKGVPIRAVLCVGACASGGLVVTYLAGWDATTLFVNPNSLNIAAYVLGTAAGFRLLTGKARWLAALSSLLCLGIFFFAGASILVPFLVACASVAYLRSRHRRKAA